MKEMITFYYNLTPTEFTQNEDNYEFKEKDYSFVLHTLTRTEEELKNIYQVCEELKYRQIPVHTFIRNRENKIVTNIYGQKYVLLKIEAPKEEMNAIDIVQFQNSLLLQSSKRKEYHNNWENLWSQKIDYFEYQVHELGKSKSVILNSFSYYIGLAENAISYANNTNKKIGISEADKISLSHKRVFFPNMKENYMNPLLFIFDLQIRDIAEYIKSAFFKNETDAKIEFRAFLNIEKRTKYEYQMFFARMLYPSYYFDVYEQVINNQESEDRLIAIIEKNANYEVFLQEVYTEICQIIPIERIDWLDKKRKL